MITLSEDIIRWFNLVFHGTKDKSFQFTFMFPHESLELNEDSIIGKILHLILEFLLETWNDFVMLLFDLIKPVDEYVIMIFLKFRVRVAVSV